MRPTIEAQGLTKRYGDTLAVDGLSFTVPAGRVTGFVGPNGRGRLIADAAVSELLGAASGDSVTVRTPAPGEAMGLLAGAGATVTSTGHDVLEVSGLEAQRIADLMAERGLRLHALTPHRATLEDAYMIRSTFMANPRRREVLGAKIAIVGGLVLGASAVATLVAFYLGQAILHGNGFTYDNGYPAATLGDADTLRTVAMVAVYPVVLVPC